MILSRDGYYAVYPKLHGVKQNHGISQVYYIPEKAEICNLYPRLMLVLVFKIKYYKEMMLLPPLIRASRMYTQLPRG